MQVGVARHRASGRAVQEAALPFFTDSSSGSNKNAAQQVAIGDVAGMKSAAKISILAGSWIVTITALGMPPFKSLFTFTSDGGLVSSTSSIMPFRPPIDRAVFSASHGAWNGEASGEFSIVLVALIHDEDAEFLGTTRVCGTIEVDETGDAFFGKARAADLDPNGDVIFAFDGSMEGERISVQIDHGEPSVTGDLPE